MFWLLRRATEISQSGASRSTTRRIPDTRHTIMMPGIVLDQTTSLLLLLMLLLYKGTQLVLARIHTMTYETLTLTMTINNNKNIDVGAEHEYKCCFPAGVHICVSSLVSHTHSPCIPAASSMVFGRGFLQQQLQLHVVSISALYVELCGTLVHAVYHYGRKCKDRSSTAARSRKKQRYRPGLAFLLFGRFCSAFYTYFSATTPGFLLFL